MEYQTIAAPVSAEFTEKHSRFIASAAPVQSEEEALNFINGIRKTYWDASHHVYAYLMAGNGAERFSDDGEPQGTAGIPVLSVLKNRGISNAAVVVTRYFGGILLGAGGLVRAYSGSARLALGHAEIITRRPGMKYRFRCRYALYQPVCKMVGLLGGFVSNAEFSDWVLFDAVIPAVKSGEFLKQISELTAGCAKPEKTEEFYI